MDMLERNDEIRSEWRVDDDDRFASSFATLGTDSKNDEAGNGTHG